MKHFMVMDVESVGLHGEAFWVAYVIVDETGREYSSADLRWSIHDAVGSSNDYAWVKDNIPDRQQNCLCSAAQFRDAFWERLVKARQDFGPDLTIWADCCWPVEANFLSACVQDSLPQRKTRGPYPLHDVATLRFAAGLDPLSHEERLENELPVHNPLADARQSARLLIEALDLLKSSGEGS